MSDDDRAERLRNKRRNVKDQHADETDEQSEQSEPDEVDETDESDKQSVKDERTGTYMYLPESQKKDVERLYNILKAEYEYEYSDFEKNRHFYPLLIKHGLDGLEGLDAQEIQNRLDGLDTET